MTTSKADFQALADKGAGSLIKVSGVWSYPGAPVDSSGTNLRLPLEYVSDADVQEGLRDGTLVAAVNDPYGHVSAVRIAQEGVTVVPAGLTGTAEMGTELPPNSRPEHDAGRLPISQVLAERQTVAGLTGEGAEIQGRQAAEDPARTDGLTGSFGKEKTQDAGARRGR
ncbi:hypothetical protein [Methylobacterium brachiatum]|uniref:hypothetical protein n=1 Tax=Methylobacterium brachiatum TaxID=269660 RepID=UPI0008E8DEF9|nr:hypothetical protein [Methylobacterium brachiatum]SFJ68122.1 hypothetical protein SAMN02799642_05154 [Methylobacterium brachiatum]